MITAKQLESTFFFTHVLAGRIGIHSFMPPVLPEVAVSEASLDACFDSLPPRLKGIPMARAAERPVVQICGGIPIA